MSDVVTSAGSVQAAGEPSAGPRGESRGDPAARIADLFAEPAVGVRRLTVDAATAFYQPGAPPRSLYFIHEGQVRVFQVGPDQSTRLLEILGPGDWFGIPALVRPSPAGTRAVAVSRAVVSEVPADELLGMFPRYPRLATELIGLLASKLHSAYAAAATLVFDDTEKRLIRTLLDFSHSAAATPSDAEHGGGDGGVVLHITHQQLAQAVGAARETISLALTQLRQRNLLRTGRNRLWFNPAALEDYRRGRSGGAPAAAAGVPGEAGDTAGDTAVDADGGSAAAES